ncbi:unnamed protein product [Rotaria socialis]|uniref:Uncharacterized protein n=1 Tax=Rotaria socialis TaxID=392032 RepID=A0A821IEH6_9BILA|nr:unnamed protein product [Rotaria socialis]CAF4450566.1 unnamed protein product [Rotaria socialis]CAF4699146.1 unnamed protein product [Rotaria socialis]
MAEKLTLVITFVSRISRNSNHQVGRPTALTKTEEKNLVDLIITLQDYGEISTCDDILKNATEFVDIMNLKSRLKNDAPTRDWYYSFLRRWKDKLKIMNSTKLEKVRANVTLSTVDGWFAKLHSVLLKLDLFNKPQQLFNCDENGFRDDPGKKVVQKDATKKLVKPNFIRLHAQLYQYALIRAHCSSALGKAGIFPYDPRAIKRDKLIKASSRSTTSNVLPRSKSVEFNYLDNEVITTTSPSPSRLDSNRNHQLIMMNQIKQNNNENQATDSIVTSIITTPIQSILIINSTSSNDSDLSISNTNDNLLIPSQSTEKNRSLDAIEAMKQNVRPTTDIYNAIETNIEDSTNATNVTPAGIHNGSLPPITYMLPSNTSQMISMYLSNFGLYTPLHNLSTMSPTQYQLYFHFIKPLEITSNCNQCHRILCWECSSKIDKTHQLCQSCRTYYTINNKLVLIIISSKGVGV